MSISIRTAVNNGFQAIGRHGRTAARTCLNRAMKSRLVTISRHESYRRNCKYEWKQNPRAFATVAFEGYSNGGSPRPTIYALSTVPGRSAIAIVRVSGSDCQYVFQSLSRRKKMPPTRSAVVSTLYSPTDGCILDKALVIFFKGPNSYTGEDLLELHLHGGPAVIRAVLEAIQRLETTERLIRSAEPGEFSRRAFMNDRLELTQIEGIRDIIDAETESQRRASVMSANGYTRLLYNGWRKVILDNMSLLTALIDFSDDSDFESADLLFNTTRRNIQKLRDEIENHLNQISRTELLFRGIQLAVIGAPNAGKSSLLNALARREIAIVSNIAGTTRDIIDVPLDIGGFKVVVGDTAGIRPLKEADTIEAEGIKRAKKRAEIGDINIAVISLEAAMNSDETSHFISYLNNLPPEQKAKPTIVVLNKCDLLQPSAVETVKEHIRSQLSIDGVSFFVTSCTSQQGIEELTSGLEKLFKSLTEVEHSDPIAVTQRAREILEKEVFASLSNFLTFEDETDVVFAAQELKAAADGIGKITGENIDIEEVLGVVFSNFCVGK